MPGQSIPTTANHPDYSNLKQATVGDASRVDGVDQALDEALPDNPLNSTLTALKTLVKQFMSRRDANGLTLLPCAYQAMVGVNEAINNNPELANAELVKSLTNTALHSGEDRKAGDDPTIGELERRGAVRALGTIVDKRPDLADASLVKNVSGIAANDPASGVRANAQNVLGKIADKRPDLIDTDMIKIVSQTAAQPIADHGERTYWGTGSTESGFTESGFVVESTTKDGKTLVGTQFDSRDNEARDTAQQTLQVMKNKRPDMFAASKPTAAALRQNGASPHLHANH